MLGGFAPTNSRKTNRGRTLGVKCRIKEVEAAQEAGINRKIIMPCTVPRLEVPKKEKGFIQGGEEGCRE